MYTLEDDQDTSSRLRQGDFLGAPFTSPLPEDASGADGADGTVAGQFLEPADRLDEMYPPTAILRRISLPKQVISSFKRLTTPGKDVGNGDAKMKRTALAAMIVACVGVFLTAMDQTVVVTALIKIIADPNINIPFTHLHHAAWIVSAYLLGFIIAMPLMGRV